VVLRESGVDSAKVDCWGMWEVRWGVLRRLCYNVNVRRVDTTHSGGEVGAGYLSSAVMTSLKAGAAPLGGQVSGQRARGVVVTTVKTSAASIGAAHDAK